jgi:hypothetical protein
LKINCDTVFTTLSIPCIISVLAGSVYASVIDECDFLEYKYNMPIYQKEVIANIRGLTRDLKYIVY